MVEVLAQQFNESNSNFTDEKELGQAKACMEELIEGQPFKCPVLRKPK